MPVVTPRFDLDPDPTLGGANASDEVGATQKAVKDYVDNRPGLTVDQTYNAISTNAQSGTAVAEAISDLANQDLSNLTSQGKNIANWSSNVTNCITEIPQDIKLELNNGTLTLKAGSKVYVPNGSDVFDEVTIASDLTLMSSATTYEDKLLICLNQDRTGASVARFSSTNNIGSGTLANRPAASSMTYGAGLYYATDENKLYQGIKSSNTWTAGDSLPLCIVSTNGSQISSIDQIFNGFGYIGSTVFALPNVKGLAPNGRNEDGSLKSVSIETSSVITRTFSAFVIGDVLLTPERVGYPISTVSSGDYNEQTNNYTNMILQGISCRIGSLYCDNTGKIVSLTIPTAFHALDYNDSSTISGWSAPSDSYIDLTLGASGATYTAPANGYYSLIKASTASGQLMDLSISGRIGIRSFSSAASQTLRLFIPVSKGSTLVIIYTLGGSTGHFRFVYAEGENV